MLAAATQPSGVARAVNSNGSGLSSRPSATRKLWLDFVCGNVTNTREQLLLLLLLRNTYSAASGAQYVRFSIRP
jgi:hypothetical protein